MSNTIHLLFHLNLQSFFSFVFICSVCSSKVYSRKDTSPNYIKFSKKETRMGRFVWFQKSNKGTFFEPCFQKLKINNLVQFEKSLQVYLSEKEGEALSAIRNTVLHNAENFGLETINEAKSGKGSNMGQELDTCNRVYEITTYNMMNVCHNQEEKCEQATVKSDSTLHCKGK